MRGRDLPSEQHEHRHAGIKDLAGEIAKAVTPLDTDADTPDTHVRRRPVLVFLDFPV